MSKVTELASGRITSTETIIVELIETNETPAVVQNKNVSVRVQDLLRPLIVHPHREDHRRGHWTRRPTQR